MLLLAHYETPGIQPSENLIRYIFICQHHYWMWSI